MRTYRFYINNLFNLLKNYTVEKCVSNLTHFICDPNDLLKFLR